MKHTARRINGLPGHQRHKFDMIRTLAESENIRLITAYRRFFAKRDRRHRRTPE